MHATLIVAALALGQCEAPSSAPRGLLARLFRPSARAVATVRYAAPAAYGAAYGSSCYSSSYAAPAYAAPAPPVVRVIYVPMPVQAPAPVVVPVAARPARTVVPASRRRDVLLASNDPPAVDFRGL